MVVHPFGPSPRIASPRLKPRPIEPQSTSSAPCPLFVYAYAVPTSACRIPTHSHLIFSSLCPYWVAYGSLLKFVRCSCKEDGAPI
eukprot:4849807-Alexandrium_andersonii.AAC.1